MTNLSDLLPAGAASKQLSFTADGAIASGQTVALQTAGTVKAVGIIAETVGTEANYQTNGLSEYAQVVADPDTGKTVIAYTDSGDSNKGKVVIATPTASDTISYGTPVEFSTTASYIGMSYDTGENKVLITYRGSGNSLYARVGTVSGTSISFGTELTVDSTDTIYETAVAYSPDTSSHMVAYSYASIRGKLRELTVSGTSVTKGSDVNFSGNHVAQIGIAYDKSTDKFVVSYQDKGNSNYGTAGVASLGGTNPSVDSTTVFESANSGSTAVAYDSSAQKVVITYRDIGNSSYPTAIVGTISGTSISFGSAVVIARVECEMLAKNVAYSSTNNKTVLVYRDKDNENGMYAVGTVSGTSISFATPVVFNSGKTTDNAIGFDATLGKFIIAYSDYRGSASNTPYGTAVTLQLASTNVSSFLGIADAAISNAASGKITMKGGVATNSQLLPLAYTGSLGSAAVYQSTATEYQGIAFDSSNNKVVVAYKNDSNAQGTAAVGTVSGTGITWGTPVVFATASTSYCDVVFDSSNNKIVIVYSDVANSEYGTAIVGTVSGTSISFGSEVVFASAATTYIRAAFDSNENKVVVAYRDDGNSQYGTAIVGNVSGTSISFGTEVGFDSTGALSAAFGGFVFDSTNNKIVIPYTRSVSHCIVGTVSGTSISFGTKVDFGGTISYQNLSVAFDSNAGKVVINGRDSNNSDYFGSLVGTVSGTSISFGTQLVIEEVHTVGATAFDSSDNQIIYAYKDNSTSSAYYRLGTVSGTSISYGSASALTSGNVAYMDSTFDSSQNTTVIIYKDVANSNYGTARGVQVSGAYPNLVPNTTYYGQDDGTLSTTSSSVTAGKAMSTNSINLDYST